MGKRPLRAYWGLVALLPLLFSGCGVATPGAQQPAPVVSAAAPVPGSTPPAAPTSRAGAFPILGAEVNGEDVAIENGRRLSLGNGLFAEVSVTPYPPAPKTEVRLLLLRGQTPVEGAEIVVVYDMVDMDHGARDIAIGREIGPGQYSISIDPFMWGDWVANAAISHPEFDASLRLLLGVYAWRSRSP
ncbi:MAG: FixH family protein [Chloroflexi bacterium]|nr:FixH family protein [Chloroflexota bacterium]